MSDLVAVLVWWSAAGLLASAVLTGLPSRWTRDPALRRYRRTASLAMLVAAVALGGLAISMARP